MLFFCAFNKWIPMANKCEKSAHRQQKGNKNNSKTIIISGAHAFPHRQIAEQPNEWKREKLSQKFISYSMWKSKAISVHSYFLLLLLLLLLSLCCFRCSFARLLCHLFCHYGNILGLFSVCFHLFFRFLGYFTANI